MTQVKKLLNVFEDFRMPATPIDQYEQTGKSILADKMNKFVQQQLPLEFVMLGFPFKSTNTRDKVIGTKPDYGEQATLENFKRFNEQIKQVYKPGVIVNMVSDGYVFNDILNVSDNIVREYKEISTDMGKDTPVRWFDLHDFYSGIALQSKRDKLMNQFGLTEERLTEQILNNPDVNFLYRGMIRFMTEELAINNYSSGNQLHKAAKKLARDMMFRNEAYSNLVRDEFADKIRLSMHPSVNNGAKYSFQLINSPKAHHSAWHCAVVIHEDQTLETIHRKDAEEKGYQLVMKDGRPYHYVS